MPAITARPSRIRCDLANPNLVRDERTGIVPSAVRGAALNVQIGLFLNGTILDTINNYDSATLKIRALSSDVIGAVQVSKGVAAAAIQLCAASAWADGSSQNTAFALTSAEMNLAAGDYWVVIAGQTTAGEVVLWGSGKLRVVDHGITDDEAESPEFLPSDGPTVKRGLATLALNDESKPIAFTTAFGSAPSVVQVTLHTPAGGYVIPHSVEADPTAAGFTVLLGAAIPGAGYKLSWLAIL